MNLSIKQALEQAIAAQQEGRAQDAERLYRAILQSQPFHPDANHNLGVLAVSFNKTDMALPLFEAALKSNPKIEQFWVSYIDALVKVGLITDAKKIIKKAVKKGLNAKKLNMLLHEPKTSVGVKKPPQKQLSSLLEHYQNGRFSSAETLAKVLIHDFPQHIFAWKLLGAMLYQIDRVQDSVGYLQMCAQLAPQEHEAQSNLALAYASLGNLDAAEVSYAKAIALQPDDPETHCNFGNTLQRMRKTDEAISSYIEAIKLKPDFADPYINLCVLYEKNNKIDLALSVLKKAKKKVSSREQDFLMSEALILFRNGDFEKSGKLIKKVNPDDLSKERKRVFLKLRADWLDNKKDFCAAFNAYKLFNKHVKNTGEYKKHNAEEYFECQRKKARQLRHLQETSPYNPNFETSHLQPTFLIGFPRSGTTLLDTILRTHSKIDVAEEIPIIIKMNRNLGSLPNISMTEDIDEAAAKVASNFYIEELGKHAKLNKNCIAIDKFPLNILEIPLINRIFPKAKFILALRHPLDCVLSCWMQDFKLNPAMSNMTDLDRITDFYATTMEILLLCEERYSLNIQKIRYEDLVIDFKKNVSNVLDFLSLDWEENIETYQNTAYSRGRINTPSYAQVIKPLYKTAAYRWKNYEQHLYELNQRLEPWVSKFGY
jgi:tetratricopeptide (TPR) repeat protein